MSASFTERLRTVKVLQAEMRQLDLSKIPDLTRMVKLMWAEKFKLPPNDERLLSLTLRDAAEQVFAQDAFLKYLREQEPPEHAPYDENAPPIAEVRTDEAARLLADTPHLTGDPEWDAVELSETDPSRASLSERRYG